jgi:hypothetical protein
LPPRSTRSAVFKPTSSLKINGNLVPLAPLRGYTLFEFDLGEIRGIYRNLFPGNPFKAEEILPQRRRDTDENKKTKRFLGLNSKCI